jgi:hypothetical protein
MADVVGHVEPIEIWAARSDEAGLPIIGYCRTESQARELAMRIALYGGHDAVSKAYALELNGQIWLLAKPIPIDLDNGQAKRDEQLRRSTIDSLSEEQIRVLGIKGMI